MTEPTKPEPKTGSPLQKKYAGMPLWAYLVAAGIMIFLLIYYRRKSAAANAAKTAATTTDNTANSSTVPPFINQVYVNPEPPDASTVPKTPVPAPESASDKRQETRTIRKAITWKNLVGYLHINSAELAKLNPDVYKKYGKRGNIPVGTVVRYAP